MKTETSRSAVRVVVATTLLSAMLAGCSDQPEATAQRFPDDDLIIHLMIDGDHLKYVTGDEALSEQEFDARLPNLVRTWGVDALVFLQPMEGVQDEAVNRTIKRLTEAGFRLVGTILKGKVYYDTPTTTTRLTRVHA